MESLTALFEFARQYWAILVCFGGMIWGLIRLSVNSNYVRHEDLKQVKDGVHEAHERLIKVEHKIEVLPTATEVAEIKLLMMELKGDAKALEQSVNALAHQVGLLLEKEIRFNTSVLADKGK